MILALYRVIASAMPEMPEKPGLGELRPFGQRFGAANGQVTRLAYLGIQAVPCALLRAYYPKSQSCH